MITTMYKYFKIILYLMRLRVVSSKEEIPQLNSNEQMIHLAFRPSNMDVMTLIQRCPRIRAVQTPPSYYRTMSNAARQFLEIQGVELLRGDVWGHRKDIDEYYEINESIIERLSRLMNEGRKIDEIVTLAKRETKLSEDLIKYILKTCAII
ncbi:MAG: Uncharacterized protein XD72_0028 [Methanothrix harundinacea]|uniref:DUF1699 family protein n=1 Tax=Methanothrix harundinacea TaxID=301375 RepID=A0A101FWF2_9EURY|nr:MAG: Uncharacterized protein XD72_0028 [Methanothrix harundinacea]